MRAGIRSRPWAGLDIGAYSIKILAAQGGAGGRWQRAEVPYSLPDADPEHPSTQESIARLISDGFSRIGLSPRGVRGVTLGIAGPDVILKQITLPMMADEEVASALRFEARKHLPFDPQGMVIDFQILSRSVTDKRLDVLLAAVANNHLEAHVKPLKLLGIESDIVDAAPLALMNGLAQLLGNTSEPQVLLDLGHNHSHLVIFQRSEPFFSRRIEFGGHALSKAIARGMQIPFEEAEEWKVAAGSDAPGFPVGWHLPEMQHVLDSLRFGLLEELHRSFAFYRTLARLPESFTLWVSGGSARLPGFAEQLEQVLGSPVRLFDPLEVTGERGRAAPQFAQVLGLALRSA
jgi:type IV pilus assembly protein PilM